MKALVGFIWKAGLESLSEDSIGEKFDNIATGRDVEWEPLVDFRRMDVSENTIHGAIAWAMAGNNPFIRWERAHLRALDDETIHDESVRRGFGQWLDWDQKSISCSSHSNDARHVAAAQSILNESEWGHMQCPLMFPWSSSDVRSEAT